MQSNSMAAFSHSYASLPSPLPPPPPPPRLSSPSPASPQTLCRSAVDLSTSAHRILKPPSPAAAKPSLSCHSASDPLRLAAAALFLGGLGVALGARPCSAASVSQFLSPLRAVQVEESSQDDQDERNSDSAATFEDKKLEEEFKTWKSKTYALTVPMRVVALRGSVPPSWVKEFIQSQGKRLKFQLKLSGSLDGIFSDLSAAFNKKNIGPSSVVAADLVSIGDSWLNFAVKKAVIQPIDGVEDQDWFKGLSSRWKVYLRRNSEGRIDPDGKVWAAPYRWGCMVIAYKKSKFQKHNLAPIEDWKDLWRPELAGRISMVDSPREVVGAVLKYMGASYNTSNVDLEVDGGKVAVLKNLESLANQVRLFDNTHYLKAFGIGDVWVAVGWSSDVLPVAKRMSNVAVVVPKSGASLWADLWAIPAASTLETDRIGGRVRGPSPLIHQWIEFCLQAARAVPFKQEVIPGASPSALEKAPLEVPKELAKGKPKLDSNLVAGVPPPDILGRCEFLEPLSDSTLAEHRWLIANMKKSNPGLLHKMHRLISALVTNFGARLNLKTT